MINYSNYILFQIQYTLTTLTNIPSHFQQCSFLCQCEIKTEGNPTVSVASRPNSGAGESLRHPLPLYTLHVKQVSVSLPLSAGHRPHNLEVSEQPFCFKSSLKSTLRTGSCPWDSVHAASTPSRWDQCDRLSSVSRVDRPGPNLSWNPLVYK